MIKFRNLIPLAFVLYLLVITGVTLAPGIYSNAIIILLAIPLMLYFGILAAAGIISALQRSIPSLVITFPIVVLVTHVAYGIGSIVGLIRRHA